MTRRDLSRGRDPRIARRNASQPCASRCARGVARRASSPPRQRWHTLTNKMDLHTRKEPTMGVRNLVAPALTAVMVTVLSSQALAVPGSIMAGAGGNAWLTPTPSSHRSNGALHKKWAERLPATSPPGTAYGQVAFDAARSQVVMFGGNTEGGYTAATWTWDGSTWAQQHPAQAPAPRVGHAFAYDPLRREIVLFGGIESETALADTWTWDGTDWARRTPAASPPARYGAAMAFDPGLGQ